MRVLLGLLLVSCGNYTDHQGWDGSTCLAIDDDALAEPVLRAADEWAPLPVDVLISMGGNCPNRAIFESLGTMGHTYIYVGIDGVAAERTIKIDPSRLSRVGVDKPVLHEFGHFLGIGDRHVRDGDGIMSADIFDSTPYQVTAADRALLGSAYGK